jgi:hypothetical protein
MGVGTSLQFELPVGCFGGLLPNNSSIKDEISVIIMF